MSLPQLLPLPPKLRETKIIQIKIPQLNNLNKNPRIVLNPTPDTISFEISIHDGYTFKSMITILQKFRERLVFLFYPGSIRCFINNESKTLLIAVGLIPHKLTRYELFGTKKFPIIVELKIQDILTQISEVKKKGSIKMFKKPGNSKLYLQFSDDGAATTSSDNLAYIPIKMLQHEETDHILPTYSRPITNPNCSILSRILCRAYTSISKQGCDSALFTMYRGGFIIDARTTDGCGKFYKFGEVEQQSTDTQNKLVQIMVNKNIFKILSKLDTLSSNGTIQFYSDMNKPIMMVTTLGDYGTLRIYIKPPSMTN